MNVLVRHRARGNFVAVGQNVQGRQIDETAMFSQEQIEFLAGRGLVFMTDRRGDQSHYGTILAHSYEHATDIARQRGCGERIIGLMGQSFLRNMKMWLRSRSGDGDSRMHDYRWLHRRAANEGRW